MVAPDYFTRKSSSTRIRPGLASALPTSPASPHTPLLGRSISSQFGSPGSFRAEEECLVYELGSRFFRAGFAGESAPRCIVRFGPEESRRVGDYRSWLRDYEQKEDEEGSWGEEWELWSMDVRHLDIGLVEDKIERAVREAHLAHLMLDSKPRKAVVAIPPSLPHPLLDTALRTLFAGSQTTSIAVFDTPVLNTVAAGLRSALVVEIGWHETVITGVYEYREVLQKRTVRGGKLLTQEMATLINTKSSLRTMQGVEELTFAGTEDLCNRLAWCKSRRRQTASEESEDELETAEIDIPLPKPSNVEITLPFPALATPAEKAFFQSGSRTNDADDHETTLHILAWKCLLALPLDVRSVCMSRIIVTGGASEIPGLKSRLIEEIEHLVSTRSWDPVMNYGSAGRSRAKALQARSVDLPARIKPANDLTKTEGHKPPADAVASSIPVSEMPQEEDELAAKILRDSMRGRQPAVQGKVRGVHTLGSWAGASLIANMRVPGTVEFTRDDYMKNGLKNLGVVGPI
ncbi:hypothetical protein H2203_007873 [Taxawa tesnikishii (nom. ined.)]|nr:hypothetical protein H2203_007873 [Dothideales sp. JES 119]